MEYLTNKSTFIKMQNANSEEAILKLKKESIDIICIDPPYLYLKNQKLEREFDEIKFFEQCKRVLTQDGFIIMFGRGVSFYRWNCILSDLGFTFKEEIVWDKRMTSSPVSPISRVHETISIYCKGKASLKKEKVPYIEQKEFDLSSVVADVKRIKSALKNPIDFNEILSFLEKREISQRGDLKTIGRNVTVQSKLKLQAQSLKTVQSVSNGMREKSIISILRDHYTSIHPTQKPVKLLERLLKLCLPNKFNETIWVADFFAGSFSCSEACYNLGVNFIGYEIDKEYFDKGVKRMEEIQFQTKLF
jgi:site-specific DNA-methyltransferase (adenine-specific)